MKNHKINSFQRIGLKTDYSCDLKLWHVYFYNITFPFMQKQFRFKRLNVILGRINVTKFM